MKRLLLLGIVLLLLCAACQTPTRQARRMVARAEALAETMPDSTARLIDSVLHMPVYFNERRRMDIALLQGEALFRDTPLDDDLFEDTAYRVATSPELERAADYYAQKKRYDRAAHAALYSGYVQQHYNEKENAMRSFKAAEQYGLLANDSLTVARAEYRMGKLLYYDGRRQEALSSFSISLNYIGNRLADLASIENGKGAAHILLNQFDSAEVCFRQSLFYAEKGFFITAKRKALNNYAVLYRLQGKFEQAIDCLKQMDEPNLTDQEKAVLYLNLGKSFAALGELDSVALYFQRLNNLLEIAEVKEETKVSAYETLFRFAENQGHDSLAIQYSETQKDALYEVMNLRQEQTLFRIQKQYDYETLQNTMNQKLVHRHRVIIIVSAIAILGLIAFALSKIRLAKISKQEADVKASLFHFMQQNKELVIKQENSEKALSNLSEVQEASQKAYQDLMSQNLEMEASRNAYAQQLSNVLEKNALIIRKLGIYLDNKGEAAYLADLKEAAFGHNTPWAALMEVFDILYPDVRKNLMLQHPELTELEQKDFVLSYFNISRDEEAVLFKKSVHSIDKIRNTTRRKMNKKAAE